jgi:hypothetical protein
LNPSRVQGLAALKNPKGNERKSLMFVKTAVKILEGPLNMFLEIDLNPYGKRQGNVFSKKLCWLMSDSGSVSDSDALG